MKREIVTRTIGDLLDHGYSIHLYCGNRSNCGRTLACDVYDLAKQFGREIVYVAKRWPIVCARCGSRDINMTIGTETRPADLVRREGPTNLRASRTDAERAEALAMIASKERAKFGL